MSQLYKVAKGVLKRPRGVNAIPKVATAADFIGQGELIPEGMLSPAEVTNLLERGLIEPLVASGQAGAEASVSAKRGKWSVDPVGLVGKNLEDLLVMVLEIDADYDVAQLDSVTAAITQLTADWHPGFRDALTRSNDRTKPAVLRQVDGAKNAGNPPLSERSREALDRAREQAAKAAPGTGDQPQG